MKTPDQIKKIIEQYKNDLSILDVQKEHVKKADVGQGKAIDETIKKYESIVNWLQWVLD